MQNSRTGFTAALSLLLISAVAVAGCSGSGQRGGQAAEKPSDSAAGKNIGAADKIAITVMRSEHPSGPLNPNAPALQQIEKATGVKIQLQSAPASDYGTKKKTLISTNRIPDALMVGITDIQDYAQTGIFLDLTPHLDQLPNLKRAMEEYPQVNRIMVDGKLYMFPLLDRVPIDFGHYGQIRTDILKKHNLPMPASFEELHQTLKQLKAAYPDSYPWTMRNGMTHIGRFLSYAYGSGYPTYYEPGTDSYRFGPLYPEFRNLLGYLNKLYAEKLLDPNYATNTNQQWQENMSSGKSFFTYDNNKFANNFNQAIQKNNPEAMIDLVPVMKSENGTQRDYMFYRGHLTEGYAISSKANNLEKVLQFFDWMYSEEGADISNYGVPGEHFTRTQDGIKLDPQLIGQFRDKNDPTRALQAHLGTGYLQFNLYGDETIFKIMSPQMAQWGEFILKQKEAGLIQEMQLDPPFTIEEAEKLKQLKAKVDTLVAQNLDKFIMGDRPLADYDKFVKELSDAGAPEIENIYNEAYRRLKK